MNANQTTKYVENGTKVLNVLDGETGTVMNGFTCEDGMWTQYEVETAYGVEVWDRSQFLLMSEIEAEV